jgi:hypothetical protein
MRGIEVIVESFIKGTSDALATKQLMAFVKEVKSKIYADPAGLGKLAHNVSESQYSRVHRPPSGEHVAGIGIALTIVYIEDTKNY